MLWNPLNDAVEYRQQAKNKCERGGGHTGKVYSSAAAMLEATELRGLNPLERALFEARYRFRQTVATALDNYTWDLRQDLDPNDIPF